MKVTKNVYMLSGSAFSAVDNNAALGEVYGICTSKGIVLVDCGRAGSGLKILKRTLSDFDIELPITHCIVTHAHHDHCGNARQLQIEGTVIIVGKEDENYCISGGSRGLNSPYEDEQVFPSFVPDILIEKDQEIGINGILFEFIKIPGHTPGSMAVRVIVDGKTLMFTGDTIQPDGMFLSSVNFGWTGDPLFDRTKLMKSLLKLMKYETDIILPGHGRICLCNGTSLLKHAAKKAYTSLR